MKYRMTCLYLGAQEIELCVCLPIFQKRRRLIYFMLNTTIQVGKAIGILDCERTNILQTVKIYTMDIKQVYGTMNIVSNN